MDLGLGLSFQSSSTVAADNSGVQILGGGIVSGASASGNTASTSQTPTQTTAVGVGGATPADMNQNPLSTVPTQPATGNYVSGSFSSSPLLILGALVFAALILRRG